MEQIKDSKSKSRSKSLSELINIAAYRNVNKKGKDISEIKQEDSKLLFFLVYTYFVTYKCRALEVVDITVGEIHW